MKSERKLAPGKLLHRGGGGKDWEEERRHRILMNHALAAFFPKRNPHVTIFDLRENSLDATTNNMLDRESLRFVNRERIGRYEGKLDKHRLSRHRYQRLLPHAYVHVILILTERFEHSNRSVGRGRLSSVELLQSNNCQYLPEVQVSARNSP